MNTLTFAFALIASTVMVLIARAVAEAVWANYNRRPDVCERRTDHRADHVSSWGDGMAGKARCACGSVQVRWERQRPRAWRPGNRALAEVIDWPSEWAEEDGNELVG